LSFGVAWEVDRTDAARSFALGPQLAGVLVLATAFGGAVEFVAALGVIDLRGAVGWHLWDRRWRGSRISLSVEGAVLTGLRAGAVVGIPVARCVVALVFAVFDQGCHVADESSEWDGELSAPGWRVQGSYKVLLAFEERKEFAVLFGANRSRAVAAKAGFHWHQGVGAVDCRWVENLGRHLNVGAEVVGCLEDG